MDKNGVLSMHDLMCWEYCPRIIYFENVLREPQAVTYKETKGTQKDRQYVSSSKRLKIVRDTSPLERKYKVWLFSRELGFQTVLDCLLFDRGENVAFPLQFKNTFTPRVIFRTQKLQIYAEALLIHECLGFSVPAGFLKFLKSNESVKIVVGETNLAQVEATLGVVKEAIRDELLPDPTPYKKRCTDCCYEKQCLRA